MSDLFPELQTSLSPRLEWMRRHEIETSFHPASGSVDAFWLADYLHPEGGHYQEIGDTEDEALTALAKAAGLKLWFEETV